MAEPFGGAVPFREAIDFLRQKVRLPTDTWTDLREGGHARAHVVAGATSDALLQDFHRALLKALEQGTTLAEFRKDFDHIVATHGWSYKGGRGWRTAVIYNTNLRMAYAAGRWKQIQGDPEVRWLRYVAILDGRTRPEHSRWHGLILPKDHPFWHAHYPPNGWNCRCIVQPVSQADLDRYGWTVSEAPPDGWDAPEARQVNGPDGPENWPTPAGIDTGFGYNVGESWLSGVVPREMQGPLPPFGAPAAAPALPPLPAPAPVDPARILPAGLAEAEYVERFLAEFGAAPGRPVAYRDVAGTRIGIDEDLFRQPDGTLKATKYGRETNLLLLADAIRDPDEIWVDWFDRDGQPALRRRYLRSMDVPGHAGGLAVVEWGARGWSGVTVFPPERAAYLERQRRGALLFKR